MSYDVVWYTAENADEALALVARLPHEECVRRRVCGLRSWFDSCIIPGTGQVCSLMMRDFLGSAACGPYSTLLAKIEPDVISPGLLGGRFPLGGAPPHTPGVRAAAETQRLAEQTTRDQALAAHVADRLMAAGEALHRMFTVARRPWYQKLFCPRWHVVTVEAYLVAQNLLDLGTLPDYKPAYNPLATQRAALASVYRGRARP